MSKSNQEMSGRLACGDEAAFAALYDACADRLFRYLVWRLGSPDAASEIVQSAFLRSVKSRRRFRDVKDPVAYVFQIACREASRAQRRRGRMQVQEQPLSVADQIAVAADPTTLADDREAIARALGKLPADDRQILELKIYGGLKFREIAVITGRPQGTVATRYRRALESLRQWLTTLYR